MERIPPDNTSESGPEATINSIGDLSIAFEDGFPTSPELVYRTVQGSDAIEDLFRAGYVRNGAAAGAKGPNRWGNRVFWNKGVSGKNHPLATGAFLIVAPHATASEGPVYKEDVTAIYTRGEDGEIIDVLDLFS